MENERFERGLVALRKVSENGLADLVQSMDAVASDLARFVIEFAYGDIYTRPGLLPNQRELCIVATLTALGNRERQLRDHIQQALNSGCTLTEVTEVVLMMAVYVGFPAAINGMEILREFLLGESPQIDGIRCNRQKRTCLLHQKKLAILHLLGYSRARFPKASKQEMLRLGFEPKSRE